MVYLSVRGLLIALFAGALAATAAAQFPSPPPPRGSSPVVQDRWPDPPKPPQAEPLQQPAPRRQPARPADDAPAVAAPAQKPKPTPRPPANIVVCGGAFAKDSSHLKLAQRFDSGNITYGQVDGPEGSKINASILYPNDPKRRLEVLWSNEGSRSNTSVIAINGKSQWSAPKGLKLGLPVAALEKLNGRAFKLTGFGADGSASVTGWEGGALSSLPGGCKVGMRLSMDPKAPDAARTAAAGAKELRSSDENLRAVAPKVVEILIGY
jgi:hypothetical protein